MWTITASAVRFSSVRIGVNSWTASLSVYFMDPDSHPLCEKFAHSGPRTGLRSPGFDL